MARRLADALRRKTPPPLEGTGSPVEMSADSAVEITDQPGRQGGVPLQNPVPDSRDERRGGNVPRTGGDHPVAFVEQQGGKSGDSQPARFGKVRPGLLFHLR